MSNPPASSRLHRGYARLVTAASSLQSPLLLAIRLYWGWQFMTRGWGKLTHHADVADYFGTLQVPVPGLNAWLAGATECFGGALLLVGLASRLVSLPLIFTMFVAYATAESKSVHAIFSDFDGDPFVSATPFLFLFACVIVLAFGPGVFSVDYLLGRRFSARR